MPEKKLYTVTIIVEADAEPEIAEDIYEWIDQCLVGDPADRPSTAQMRARFADINIDEDSLHAGNHCTVVEGKHIPEGDMRTERVAPIVADWFGSETFGLLDDES